MGFPAFCSPFFLSVKREILYFPYTCEWVFCFALLCFLFLFVRKISMDYSTAMWLSDYRSSVKH